MDSQTSLAAPVEGHIYYRDVPHFDPDAPLHALLCTARLMARRHESVISRKQFMVLDSLALERLASLKLCAEGRECRWQAAQLAIASAAALHVVGGYPEVLKILVLLGDALDDDDSADRLLLAVAPRLYRNGLAQHLAIALLRYATITQHRGDWDLAARRARRAVEYLGEITDERRRAIAQRIIDYRP